MHWCAQYQGIGGGSQIHGGPRHHRNICRALVAGACQQSATTSARNPSLTACTYQSPLLRPIKKGFGQNPRRQHNSNDCSFILCEIKGWLNFSHPNVEGQQSLLIQLLQCCCWLCSCFYCNCCCCCWLTIDRPFVLTWNVHFPVFTSNTIEQTFANVTDVFLVEIGNKLHLIDFFWCPRTTLLPPGAEQKDTFVSLSPQKILFAFAINFPLSFTRTKRATKKLLKPKIHNLFLQIWQKLYTKTQLFCLFVVVVE